MQIRSRKALDETAITMKTTKINKITKTSKFCRAIDEKWRGNANEVQEGPPRNSENCENNDNFEILQGFWRKETKKCKWGQGGPSTKQEKLRKLLTKKWRKWQKSRNFAGPLAKWWWGNANEVQEGPRRNSQKFEGHYWWQRQEFTGSPEKPHDWTFSKICKNASYEYLVTYFNNTTLN